ncbi:MAG: cytochrome c maturation protein CcmE [Dehalococcoidia bacterium]|nr:cytochrome c maturation protein CcmE [Dehalococcoidia bacterium]
MQKQAESIKKRFAWTSRTRKLVIVGTVIALAIGFLTFQTFQSASEFVVSVSDLKTAYASGNNKETRVIGKVMVSSINRNTVNKTMAFSITDGVVTIPVIYRGGVTTQFYQADADVVIEGKFDSSNTFVASNVISRHASTFKE